MISVITPTIRKKGLSIVKKALEQQTLPRDSFEWLIGSKFDPGMGKWVRDDFEGGLWTLNRIYNRLIEVSKGDLIVSIQDYTYFLPEALEKFLFHYKQQPKTLVTGVGNKYTDKKWQKMVWKDPRTRKDQGSFYPCYFNDVEGNYCSCPRQAIYNIGGFDERADFEYFGMDWYGVLERMNDLKKGYDFYIDQTNESFSLVHGRVDNWEKDNGIHGPYQKRRKEMKSVDMWPVMSWL